MGDFPAIKLPTLVTIHPWSLEAIGLAIIGAAGTVLTGTVSALYPAVNLATLVPFVVGKSIVVVKMFTYNGSTVSGNLDVGIYTSEGGTSPNLQRIVSMGSTAQSGTNTIQELDIADTILVPGLYYMAIAMDNVSGTFFRGSMATQLMVAACRIRFKTSAFPLPATITAPDDTQANYIPVFGLTTRSVI